MTKFQRTSVAAVCCIIASFLLLGWIGDYDYCEQVILHMSQEQYDSVKRLLTEQNGSAPSERDIAHWWADHHME
jgi:hypothetical protein